MEPKSQLTHNEKRMLLVMAKMLDGRTLTAEENRFYNERLKMLTEEVAAGE